MPYKDPVKRREANKIYSARYYAKNREAMKAATSRAKALAKQRWRAFKASLSCVACGVSHADLLDFHHLPEYRGDPEKMPVNNLVAQSRFTRAYTEVKKCVPLCANCHRLGHLFERRGLPENPSGLFLAISRYFVLPEKSYK